MAAEAIFRQVRRPPPRIYRGIALSACWTSDGIAGDGGYPFLKKAVTPMLVPVAVNWSFLFVIFLLPQLQ